MYLFKELTESQRKHLFILVDYQKNLHKDVRFRANLRGSNFYISEHEDAKQGTIQEIPVEYLKIWEQNGFLASTDLYFSRLGRSTDTSFMLRKEAFDYEDFMQKSKLQKFWITLWSRSSQNMAPLMLAIIAAVITTIVTDFILTDLGLIP